MSVDQTCEKIIKQICESKLHYHMNQTPYSIYFSIRKKFIKGFEPKSAGNNKIVHMEPELELLNLKNEYAKLYTFYESAVANENLLKCEISRLAQEVEVKSKDDSKHKFDAENKLLRNELSESKAKYEKKCVEIKAFKDDNESIRKEMNSLSVALKRSKKEHRELSQSHEKEIKLLEKRIVELVDYKNKKMADERGLKLQQRKEIKKARQLLSKNDQNKVPEDDTFNESDSNKNIVNVPVSNCFDALITSHSEENSHLSSSDTPLSFNHPAMNVPETTDPARTTSFTATTTFSSSSATTCSTIAPSPCSSMVTDTTGDTYSEKEATAEILAELKKFSNSIDKCIEEIRK